VAVDLARERASTPFRLAAASWRVTGVGLSSAVALQHARLRAARAGFGVHWQRGTCGKWAPPAAV